MAEAAKHGRPEFMINFEVRESGAWKHLVTEPVLPACLPSNLPLQAVKVTAKEWPLRSTVRMGIFLTDKQLKQIITSIGAQDKLPLKGEGSGSNGRLVKRDRAKALVTFLHPDASAEDAAYMINCIANQRTPKRGTHSSTNPSDILGALATLDPNDDSFKEISKSATQEHAT